MNIKNYHLSIFTFIITLLLNPTLQQINNCQDYYQPLSRGCKTCNQGYYKFLNHYFLCYKCSKNCLECLDKSTCLKCKEGNFMKKINNKKEDIQKFSLPLYNKTCESCLPNCANCTSSEKCDDCVRGYIISNGACYKKNPILSFVFTISLCVYVFIICLRNSFREIDKIMLEKRKVMIKEGEKRLRQQRNRILSLMTVDSALAVRNTILKKKENDLRSSRFENKQKEKIDKKSIVSKSGFNKRGRSKSPQKKKANISGFVADKKQSWLR